MQGTKSFTVDPNFLAALPPGWSVIANERHGKTNWSTGYKATIEHQHSLRIEILFVKILRRTDAAAMALGEYESQNALHRCLPRNCPAAMTHGTLEKDSNKAFFMGKYRSFYPNELKQEALAHIEPRDLATIMQTLHSSPNALSPNGKFGFPVTTFKGYAPIDNSWCETWEEYFTRGFKNDIAWEQGIRGADPEFMAVADKFFDIVVPRLLRPLETDGRSVEPVLLHGDLWDGNIEFDMITNEPVLFDACCCYGHREFELAAINTGRYQLGERRIKAYLELMPASEPEDDFEDRMLLYSMRHDIVAAGHWDHCAHLRRDVQKQMLELLEKYPDGLQSSLDKTPH